MAGTAIAAGMQAFGHTEVTGFELERGQVRAVETTRGRIRTGTVVLAAGIWGPKVARLAGVRLPLTPVVHQYAITAPLPELAGETREVAHPLLRHQDADLYYRQIGDAYGIGNYDHEPRLVDAEAIRPWTDGGEQPSILPFTPEDFERAAEETARLLPAVGRAQRVRSFDGLMSFTPDGMPLIGEAAAARGLWLCEAIWVTHCRRRRAGARRAARPRRRAHRPARVRPAALRRARALAHVREGTRRAAVPRGLRRAASAPAERAAARPAAHAAVARAARPRRGLLRERGLGAPAVVRGQRRPGPRRGRPAPRLAGAAVVADRGRRAPRLPRAGGDVRPHAVHQGRGARPGGARLPPGARRQRRRPPGRARSSTRRCAPRAAGSCAISRSRASTRTASSSSPAARSAGTTSRG